MTAAAIPPAIAPRVGALLRMLASPIDGEALNAVRALGRTLGGVGLDFHTLADAVEAPPARPVTPPAGSSSPRGAARPRARQGRQARAGDVELDFARRRNVVEALRRGLAGGRMTEWEHTFAGSIVEQLQGRRWTLTERQAETLARLLGKIGESMAWV